MIKERNYLIVFSIFLVLFLVLIFYFFVLNKDLSIVGKVVDNYYSGITGMAEKSVLDFGVQGANGIIEKGEVCDGNNVSGYTCSTFSAGFKSGTLSCNEDRQSYNTSLCILGNEINVFSCSQTYVQNAIDSASNGDIINVPAGGCTWSSGIVINKSIVLKGAGVGKTVIKAATGFNDFLVVYEPARLVTNRPFRITGFTFDLNNNSMGIGVINPSTTNMLRGVRIDHNNFINCLNGASPAIEIDGTAYGVVDHNSFSGYPHMDNYGLEAQSWNYLTFEYGGEKNVYYENNNFTGMGPFFTGGQGGRYSARYNTFNYNRPNGLYPWFDASGNQPSGARAIMGVEVYGNLLNINVTPGNGVRIFDHRGGESFIFQQ